MTEKLPSFLKPSNSDELIFKHNEITGKLRAHTVEANGTDKNGYIIGDMPKNAALSIGHGDVYITGEIQSGAKIHGRNGMLSAQTISLPCQIMGGSLCLVSNETPPETLYAITEGQEAPPILTVPESLRADIFDVLALNQVHVADLHSSLPINALKTVQAVFSDAEMHLYYRGEEIRLPPLKKSEANTLKKQSGYTGR